MDALVKSYIIYFESEYLDLSITLNAEENTFWYVRKKGKPVTEVCNGYSDLVLQLKFVIWSSQIRAWFREKWKAVNAWWK